MVGILDGGFNLREGDVLCPQFIGIDHHLILLDHTADGGDFRHAGHRLQLIFGNQS